MLQLAANEKLPKDCCYFRNYIANVHYPAIDSRRKKQKKSTFKWNLQALLKWWQLSFFLKSLLPASSYWFLCAFVSLHRDRQRQAFSLIGRLSCGRIDATFKWALQQCEGDGIKTERNGTNLPWHTKKKTNSFLS